MMDSPTITFNSRQNQPTTNWQGGITTQLFIFPLHAEYAQRNFLFRISTAKIETENSTFTSLPNFNRILMVLNGTLTITHKKNYSKTLKKYETDSFSGSWETESIGKVTDFNLMMAIGVEGNITQRNQQKKEQQKIKTTHAFTGFYLAKGKATINQTYGIKTNDFMMVRGINTLEILALENCEWVIVTIEKT